MELERIIGKERVGHPPNRKEVRGGHPPDSNARLPHNSYGREGEGNSPTRSGEKWRAELE